MSECNHMSWMSKYLGIMNIRIRTTCNFVVCLSLVLFPKADLLVKHYHYQRNFKFTSFGSMTNDQEVLFSGEGNTFHDAVKLCAEFCRRDRRCIGMELCKITEDRIRCRVCCKTKTEEEGIPLNNTDRCRYMAMVWYNFPRKIIKILCLCEIRITTKIYNYDFFFIFMYKGCRTKS